MPEAGLEPAHLSVLDFESSASTNFTTRAGAGVYRLGVAEAITGMHMPSLSAGDLASLAVQAAWLGSTSMTLRSPVAPITTRSQMVPSVVVIDHIVAYAVASCPRDSRAFAAARIAPGTVWA